MKMGGLRIYLPKKNYVIPVPTPRLLEGTSAAPLNVVSVSKVWRNHLTASLKRRQFKTDPVVVAFTPFLI
jgi:hypothetical protein